ncbi:membrane protein insertion efficiency factor YidD [Streptacidiphilus sp. N1-12]|uniref:Membrane protein insertion efficiency factor YidD n=2 Tax=Streptacidiphilus alkalitolerans TaxID=3342712 RepID=A0ABV6WEE5_9ACTN
MAGKYLLLAGIRVYQWTISPLLGPVCRYHPSCSRYGFEAIKVHGALKGSALTAWRILRCNPWAAGGFDYVPARKHPVWYRWVLNLPSRDVGPHTSSDADAPTPSTNAQGA